MLKGTRTSVLLTLTALGVGYGALQLSAQPELIGTSAPKVQPMGGDCCSGDWCFASDDPCTGTCAIGGLKQCPC